MVMSESPVTDMKVLVADLIRLAELKSLGDLRWRETFEQRIVLFADENYQAGFNDGWREAWAIAE
jgi:hypothetical protein